MKSLFGLATILGVLGVSCIASANGKNPRLLCSLDGGPYMSTSDSVSFRDVSGPRAIRLQVGYIFANFELNSFGAENLQRFTLNYLVFERIDQPNYGNVVQGVLTVDPVAQQGSTLFDVHYVSDSGDQVQVSCSVIAGS